MHVDRELAPLKKKLVIITPLGEQILRTSVFNRCEILVEGVVLKANLILLEVYNFDMILVMDWLSTHRAFMDCFTKKIEFQKSGYLELEFEGDRRILSICVISTLEAKRLLHKGCKAYLTRVVDKSTLKIAFG